MSYSYTYSETRTFTVTHAKQLASKVATDLKRIQRFYGSPSDSLIDAFEEELILFLKSGYLEDVTYGFRRNGDFIEPSIKYTARELISSNAIDDDPGKIRPGSDITNAVFGSFLNYSNKWFSISSDEQKSFKNQLPFQRVTSSTPGYEGYYLEDKIYSSGGRSLNRSSLRKY